MMVPLDNDWWIGGCDVSMSCSHGRESVHSAKLDWIISKAQSRDSKKNCVKMVDLAIEFNLPLILHLQDHVCGNQRVFEVPV